jgi:glycosyltransferase involved in cell wall biosynthesis
LRVAILSYELPPDTGHGGIGTFSWTHARALAALGHEVEALAGSPDPGEQRVERIGDVVVRRRGDRRRPGAVCRGLRALGWWWSANRLENALRMKRLLAEAARGGPFDLIEMPDCGAEGLRLGPGAPRARVVRFHSPAALIMREYDTRPGDRRLCGALERRAALRAGAFISCSRFLAAKLPSIGFALPVTTIPNGLELEPAARGEPGAWRRRLALHGDRPLVLFSGRLEPRKGMRLMLEVVPELLRRRDVAVVLAGDDLFGHAERELTPRCAGLRGSLHRLGRLENDEVRALEREADVVWVPSRWESCPYVVLEAMAAGRHGAAIAAAAAGGIPELVTDGTEALLAPVDDVARHLAVLERLLDDRELRRSLGAAAYRRVAAEHSPRKVAERSLEVYRALTAAGDPRGTGTAG